MNVSLVSGCYQALPPAGGTAALVIAALSALPKQIRSQRYQQANMRSILSGTKTGRLYNDMTNPSQGRRIRGAGGRTRTGTVSLPGDFKSHASAIPPLRQCKHYIACGLLAQVCIGLLIPAYTFFVIHLPLSNRRWKRARRTSISLSPRIQVTGSEK